jgi:hypothetical protein
MRRRQLLTGAAALAAYGALPAEAADDADRAGIPASPYPEWSYAQAIAVDHRNGSDSVTNYPAVVTLSPDNFNYLNAKPSGTDIRFTDSDAVTPIPYAIRDWYTWAQTIVRAIPVPRPYLYATVAIAGTLSASNQLVVGAGSDLNVDPVRGQLTVYNSDGAIAWIYNSANTDYVMSADIGSLNGDGNNNVAVGFRNVDHCGTLLDKDGNVLWIFPGTDGKYIRVSRIGKITADPGNQVLFAGAGGHVTLLDKWGNVLWALSLGDDGTSYTTVQSGAIGDADLDGQNEIYLAYNSKVLRYDGTGAQVWATPVGDTTSFCYSIAVAKVTNAIAGLQIIATVGQGNDSLSDFAGPAKVVVLDFNGNILWMTNTPAPAWSCAAYDVNGDGLAEVFVGYGTHHLLASDLGTGGVLMLDGPTGKVIGNLALPSSSKVLRTGDALGDGTTQLLVAADDGYARIITTAEGINATIDANIAVLAGNRTKTIYMYYGNSEAPDAQTSRARYSWDYPFTGPDGAHPSGWTDQFGTWETWSNTFRSPNSGDSSSRPDVSCGDNIWGKNFVITFYAMKNNQGTGSHIDCYFGVYYRVHTWSDGLPNAYLLMMSAQGHLSLSLMPAGSNTPSYTLYAVEFPLMTLSTVVNLRVVVQGNRHGLDRMISNRWINVFSVIDNNAGKLDFPGPVALMNYRGQTQFFKFRVAVAPDNAPAVTLGALVPRRQ